MIKCLKSRYSIIQDLTNKKNAIEKEIVNLQINSKNERANFERRMEDAQRQLTREEEDLKRKEEAMIITLESKQKEINNYELAIQKIGEISNQLEKV